MSWMQKLYQTYERCAGNEPEGAEPLMPICHSTQQAHIEIVIDGNGNFRRVSVLEKASATTLIPCTEASGGRSGSRPVNHPLADKLQYIAGDFADFGGEVTSGFAGNPSEPYDSYVAALVAWASYGTCHPKLAAILRYVKEKHVVADLVKAGVLPVDDDKKLLKEWTKGKDSVPAIFKVIPATQSPQDAFVRWKIEADGEKASGAWQDQALIQSWIDYYQHSQSQPGVCMVSGLKLPLAIQHPAKLRNAADKAKLISSNDNSGFTFRGRFLDAGQALSVGFEQTQKAHNALRWLIARQGYKHGDMVVVSWAVSGHEMPNPFNSTLALLGIAPLITNDSNPSDTAQAFAIRLNRAIAGYRAKLDKSDGIVVMAIDAATPGRMGIVFYRELQGSEFLSRIEQWHLRYAWQQYSGKGQHFIGVPELSDIAKAAYGPRSDEKLTKATIERLLPCVVDGISVARDLVASAIRRASNRMGFKEQSEWEKCLGIACALFNGYYHERSYQMALEQGRVSRDYLYGRLLAVAEHIESRALFVAGERRETTASRLMQRFADRPYSTWKTIELALVPYKARLLTQRTGFLVNMNKLLDEIMWLFQSSEFTDDSQLSGEFLLGYHCQMQALRPHDDTHAEEQLV